MNAPLPRACRLLLSLLAPAAIVLCGPQAKATDAVPVVTVASKPVICGSSAIPFVVQAKPDAAAAGTIALLGSAIAATPFQVPAGQSASIAVAGIALDCASTAVANRTYRVTPTVGAAFDVIIRPKLLDLKRAQGVGSQQDKVRVDAIRGVVVCDTGTTSAEMAIKTGAAPPTTPLSLRTLAGTASTMTSLTVAPNSEQKKQVTFKPVIGICGTATPLSVQLVAPQQTVTLSVASVSFGSGS